MIIYEYRITRSVEDGFIKDDIVETPLEARETPRYLIFQTQYGTKQISKDKIGKCSCNIVYLRESDLNEAKRLFRRIVECRIQDVKMRIGEKEANLRNLNKSLQAKQKHTKQAHRNSGSYYSKLGIRRKRSS